MHECILQVRNILTTYFKVMSLVDVAKRAGQVGFGSGQSGLRVKRVTGQNGSFLKRVNQVAGQTGRGLSRVELTRIFQTIFFFENRCNLSIVYEFLNCD